MLKRNNHYLHSAETVAYVFIYTIKEIENYGPEVDHERLAFERRKMFIGHIRIRAGMS